MKLVETKVTHCLCGLLYTQAPPINYLMKIYHHVHRCV